MDMISAPQAYPNAPAAASIPPGLRPAAGNPIPALDDPYRNQRYSTTFFDLADTG